MVSVFVCAKVPPLSSKLPHGIVAIAYQAKLAITWIEHVTLAPLFKSSFLVSRDRSFGCCFR